MGHFSGPRFPSNGPESQWFRHIRALARAATFAVRARFCEIKWRDARVSFGFRRPFIWYSSASENLATACVAAATSKSPAETESLGCQARHSGARHDDPEAICDKRSAIS
jgi:hypothetical protein